MSKSLRSRTIDFCLEENGDPFDRSNHRAEMTQLPEVTEPAQQSTPVFALYEACSSDKHSASLFADRE